LFLAESVRLDAMQINLRYLASKQTQDVHVFPSAIESQLSSERFCYSWTFLTACIHFLSLNFGSGLWDD